MLNWVDLTIIGLVAFSVLISIIRGFVRETLSLVAWIAAFWVALTFSNALADGLVAKYVANITFRYPVAFGVLFIVTLIAGAFVNYTMGVLVDKTGLGGTDRALGTVFGFARGILLVAVLLLLTSLTPMAKDKWWKDSVLVPHFTPIETWLKSLLPESIDKQLKLNIPSLEDAQKIENKKMIEKTTE